jgi:hypothetical protein
MRALLAVIVAGTLLACSASRGRDAAVEEAGALPDVPVDAAIDVPPVDPCAPTPCGPVELCGVVDGRPGPGNGLDDNCNGMVDEGCRCRTGAVQSCFPGPPDRRGVGPCRDGMAVCGELEWWGPCEGAVLPTEEICDGIDNDCDGQVDEDLADCASTLQCPSHASARPLSDFEFDGLAIDPSARDFHWTLECPTTVTSCPTPADPTASTLRVRVLQSGRYPVQVRFTRGDGSTGGCRFPLYVAGEGLRVELDWNTKGGIESAGTDLDLHVAAIDRTGGPSPRWFTLDDCYYATCTAPGGRVDWRRSADDPRFAPTEDIEACAGAPPPHGERWRASGRCWNPRLDIDDEQCDPAVLDRTDPRFCFIENINVDHVPQDVTFRVMVNFYRDHGTCADDSPDNDITYPQLSIFCGGIHRAGFGDVDTGLVPMHCAQNPSIGSANWSWLAADVRFVTNACGLQDCKVRPLQSPASRYPRCESITELDDVCQDAVGRLFVRRAGARPVDAELPASF